MRKGGSWEYVRCEDPRNEREQGPGLGAQNTNKCKKGCECALCTSRNPRGERNEAFLLTLSTCTKVRCVPVRMEIRGVRAAG